MYELNDDGSRGTELAHPTTNTNGEYSFSEADLASKKDDTAYVMVASGGTYTNEADGAMLELTGEVTNFVPNLSATELAEYSGQLPLTPLTDVMAKRAFEAKQAGMDWNSTRDAVVSEIRTAYGISPDAIPYNPYNPDAITNSTDDRAKYMQVLAGMSEAAATAGVDPSKYMVAMADDFKDGTFDGKLAGTSVTFENGATFPTNCMAEIVTGMAAWDHAPSGVSLPPPTQYSFNPAPPSSIDDVTGYYAVRDPYSGSYNTYLDPESSKYQPMLDTHNGAAYDSAKDPCNSGGAAYDLAKCPTNGSFNVDTFNSYAGTISQGTYDPKTGVYTNASGVAYEAGSGGQFVSATGESVPPPVSSATGTTYTGSYSPGTTCAAGTYWDAATATCKTPASGTTCPTGQWYDYTTESCKTMGASYHHSLAKRIGYASFNIWSYIGKRLAKLF